MNPHNLIQGRLKLNKPPQHCVYEQSYDLKYFGMIRNSILLGHRETGRHFVTLAYLSIIPIIFLFISINLFGFPFSLWHDQWRGATPNASEWTKLDLDYCSQHFVCWCFSCHVFSEAFLDSFIDIFVMKYYRGMTRVSKCVPTSLHTK